VDVRDFNNDDHLDIAVLTTIDTTGNVYVLLDNNNATFEAQTALSISVNLR
jgi:hypothetical protein